MFTDRGAVLAKPKMHGVKRVAVFCCMTVLLPALLITISLYLRHTVFADVVIEVAESDVLAIEEGISSIFCAGHTLRMNTSFNAFQLRGTPRLSKKKKHIRLKKSMRLPDDTLEYWGFYLLKGAMVRLKVCSGFEGSRILVVRGDKTLRTCGLLEHNLRNKGANLDQEHSQVKVTFETNAENLGLVDDKNTAAEDLTFNQTDQFVKERLEKGRERQLMKNKTKQIKRHINKHLNPIELKTNKNMNKMRKSKHKQRHRKHKHKVQQLKSLLEEQLDNQRPKRATGPFDAHITHGGNAHNISKPNNEGSSASSFEMDLYKCYDGHILLTEGFPPSTQCQDVHYLESGNHMVTTHEVASDGYYYYIFYSDNDLYSNSIHAIFDIYKPTYRYANSSSAECVNQTECSFELSFLSDERVIVEVPTRDGIEHEADDITLLTSVCHPRVVVYMFFPISVLFLILGCAFL